MLQTKLGEQPATDFFSQVKENAVVLSGNKQVAQAVSAGEVAFGLTDTDDALLEIDNGLPVAIIFPDQAEGQMGTLLIPNTLAILKGAKASSGCHRIGPVSLERGYRRQTGDEPKRKHPDPSQASSEVAGQPRTTNTLYGNRLRHRGPAVGICQRELAKDLSWSVTAH